MKKPVFSGTQREKIRHILAKFAIDSEKWKDWHLFTPLVMPAPYFGFDELKLYSHGDSILQNEVYTSIKSHCMRAHLFAVSTTVVKACGAAYMNPCNLQRIAEEIGLLDARNDVPDINSALPASTDDNMSHLAPYFDPKSSWSSIDRKKLRGTSFDFYPHEFCQDKLGVRLSHFVAAVDIDQGREKAQGVARQLLGIGAHDPFTTGLFALQSTIRHYRSTGRIALALLSAMGIQPLWDVQIDTAPAEAEHRASECDHIGKESTVGEGHENTADAILTRPTGTVELARSASMLSSNAALKPVDAGAFLSALTQCSGAVNQIAPDVRCDGKPFTDMIEACNDPFTKEYFDARVRKFPKSIEQQHSYFAVDRDVEKGVQFDTGGMDAKSFIETFRRKQARLFTVTLRSHSTQDIMAVAQAPGYIAARAHVLDKVLLLIAQDLHNVAYTAKFETPSSATW